MEDLSMALKCFICDGTDFLKTGDFFVCQSCGCKYTLEDARKMLAEGGSSAGSPVAAAPSQNNTKIENYLNLARSAKNAENNEEAEKYASQVIELDPSQAEAWLIKGIAAGWQSKVGNSRLTESIECWSNAIKYATEEQKAEFLSTIQKNFVNILTAIMHLCANNFAEYPSDNNTTSIQINIKTALSNFSDYISKIDSSYDMSSCLDDFALILEKAASSASSIANVAYGPEKSDQNKYAYRTWLEKQTYCVTVMDLALAQATSISTASQIVSSLSRLHNRMIGSCSYRFVASGYGSYYTEDTFLNDSAKASHRAAINKAEAKLTELKRNIAQKEKAEQEKAVKEREARVNQYWEEHSAEKDALETERTALEAQLSELSSQRLDLSAQIAEIEKTKNQLVPAAITQNELKDEVAKIRITLSGLSVFKAKEKKMLSDQLEEKTARISSLTSDIKKQKAKIEQEVSAKAEPLRRDLDEVKAKIEDVTNQIAKLNLELTKDR